MCMRCVSSSCVLEVDDVWVGWGKHGHMFGVTVDHWRAWGTQPRSTAASGVGGGWVPLAF